MTETREKQIREALEGLTPEGLRETTAYADHLLAAQESGEQPMEPAEFSEMYQAQQQELSKEGAFFLMAAGFAPFYQRVTFCCILKAAREHPALDPLALMPKIVAEMEAVNRLLQEPEEDAATMKREALAA